MTLEPGCDLQTPTAIGLAGERSLAVTMALTLEEFLQAPGRYMTLIRKRLAETRLSAEEQLFLASFREFVHFVALVSVDDPDTVSVLPIVVQVVAACPRFDLHILRDDHDLTLFNELVDEFDLIEHLDDLDLPVFFLFDEEWHLQAQWGPRPVAADGRLDHWLALHPAYEVLADAESDADHGTFLCLLDELTYEMRVWYNSGLSRASVSELCAVLASLQTENEEEEPES